VYGAVHFEKKRRKALRTTFVGLIYIFIRHEGSTTNSKAKHINKHYNDLRKERKKI